LSERENSSIVFGTQHTPLPTKGAFAIEPHDLETLLGPAGRGESGIRPPVYGLPLSDHKARPHSSVPISRGSIELGVYLPCQGNPL